MTALSKLCLKTVIVALAFPLIAAASQTPATTEQKQAGASTKVHQPRPNPDASGKYHVGDGVTPPKLIHSAEPAFPKKMRTGNSDRCTVALTVDTEGKPTDVHVALVAETSGREDNGDLSIETRAICVNTVEQYRFKPATFQGKPVPVDLKVEINFKTFP